MKETGFSILKTVSKTNQFIKLKSYFTKRQ